MACAKFPGDELRAKAVEKYGGENADLISRLITLETSGWFLLLLVPMVGISYVSVITPMVCDYAHPANGLVVNNLT